MDRLVLAADAVTALLDHARAGRGGDPPAEVCGVLGGRWNDGGGVGDENDGDVSTANETAVVTGVHPVENVAPAPRSTYELDPAMTLSTIERIEAAGDEVIGFYHSHPAGPGGPSETDRARATWSGYVYCIVSFGCERPPGALEAGEARIGAWRWTGTRFETLSVAVGDDAADRKREDAAESEDTAESDDADYRPGTHR